MTNLLEVANQIATTATGLHKKVIESGKPMLITVQQLAKKMPELQTLPSDIPIFRLRQAGQAFECDSLAVYVGPDGEPTVYQPDLEALPGFSFIRYKTGIGGYCDIEYEKGLELRIAISVSDDHIVELVEQNSKGLEAEGSPLPHYLRLVPQPEIPIYSDVLPMNTELTILSNGLKSRKYETPMVTVKAPNGEVFKNVICNADLQRIVETHGLGAKFKIVSKRPRVNREGEPINSEGKVDKKNPSMIVKIADLQGIDFSDL